MRSGFILSCESTIDLPYSYCEQREIPVLFYSYQVDGVSYEDDMGRDPEALPRFYGFLDAGKLPSTAQLNEFQYETFFDTLLQQGDVLHIAFGSGMTASVQNALLAAEALREKYPERKLIVIDSLCLRPVTVCWLTVQPICATKESPWTRLQTGCLKSAKKSIISFIPRN